MTNSGNTNRVYFHICSIIFLGFLIYLQTFHHSFHFDDFGYISNNLAIQNLQDLKSIWQYFREPTRFITLLTFALNYYFHRLDVFGYHLVNLLIHLSTAILVYWLAVQTFKLPSAKILRDDAENLAFVCALIFVSHPVQTQAVTYIVQRFASLATMFYVGSLCCYIKARRETVQKALCWFFFSGVFVLLGMMSKEIVFTLPIMILLYEYSFLRKESKSQAPIAQDSVVKIIIVSIFLLLIPLFFRFDFNTIFNTKIISESHSGDVITPVNYLLTQFQIIWTYIRLSFFPINQKLDYDYPLTHSLFEPYTLLCFLGLLGIWIFTILNFAKNRLLCFAVAWFFITLSVESSIIPIRNIIFEHRLYLPMIGFALFLAIFLYQWINNKKFYWMLMSSVIIVLSVLTIARNQVWQNEIALWSDNALKTPNKARSWINLGRAYLEDKQLKKALEVTNRGLTLDPNDKLALNNRGLIYSFLNDHVSAQIDFNRAIAIDPLATAGYNNRAQSYEVLKKYDLAMADYNKILELDPRNIEAHINRGNLYGRLGQLDLAINDYTTVISIRKDDPAAYFNRGNKYGMLGKYDLALADFNKSIELEPRRVEAFMSRASTYVFLGNITAALDDYDKAIQLNPNLGMAYFKRSEIYLMQGQKEKALHDIKIAESLHESIPQDYLQQFNIP